MDFETILVKANLINLYSNGHGVDQPPVLTGTYLTLWALFAELSSGSSIDDIAEDFDLLSEQLQDIMQCISHYFKNDYENENKKN